MQNNGTFDIEHIYSKNYNAIKAHYFFIQFAQRCDIINKTSILLLDIIAK